VREALLALPILEAPLELALFEEAAQLYRTARRAGYTIRSSADCLIAACAIRNQATVLHYDRDFELLAKVSRLEVRRIVI
jgi:predicted nucleic acid-binding protein